MGRIGSSSGQVARDDTSMVDDSSRASYRRFMGDLIPIHTRRIFTEGDAVSLLPIIRRITEHTAEEVDALQEQLRFVPHDEPLHKRLYAQVEATVRRWAIKVSKLGCEPRGIWLVDFDAGEGWYTWRLGDEGLTFFHSHARPAGADSPAFPREIPS